MTEGPSHIVPIKSDEDLERSAVAGAAAVERLIADRNNLRSVLAAHERELAASRAAEEDLKRQLGMLHQRYLELAKRVVSQLQQFDCTMREAIAGRPESTHGEPARGPGCKPIRQPWFAYCSSDGVAERSERASQRTWTSARALKAQTQEPRPNHSAKKPTLLIADFSSFPFFEAQVRSTPSHHLMASLARTRSHAMGGKGWAT
jgi:hypothetical protein